MKILFVEDDIFLRETLQQVMKEYGYEVTAFNRTKDALALYRKEFFPIIITDVNLPGMDGIEFCRQIRLLSNGKDSIIIVETGFVKPQEINLVLDAGADDYIPKPIDEDFLKIRLRIAENHYTHRYQRRKAEQEAIIQKEHLEILNEAMHQMNLGLLEKEKILVELNATKDKFCSILAHDIKNPLTSIVGFSQMLKEYFNELNDAEKKEMVLDIDNASQNLLNLIEDLLEWSRTQRGKIQLNPQLIHLSLITYNEVSLLMQSAIAKHINLEYQVDESLTVFADKYMVSTVIRNLISNAIKFTPTGGKISIISEKKGDFVETLIIDNGIGINKEDLLKLFRADIHYTTTGTNNERGTGLGLLLCKEFLEKNGGKIGVESQVEKGTTFSFSLPQNKL